MVSRSQSIVARIYRLMSDGKPRTTTQISKELPAPIETVRSHMARASKEGDGQKYHVAGRVTSYNAALYVFGPGANYVDFTEKDESEMTDEELDRLHRSQAHWPAADPVLTNAFRAMVTQGAPA